MKKDWKQLLIIVTLAMISMIPMITEPHIHGHDTIFHVANIDQVTETLNKNFFFVPIASKVGNNLGYGTHLFYPVLPHITGSYITRITSFLGGDTFDGLTVTYTLVSIISAIIMYYLAMRLFKRKTWALITATIYIFMPYRLGDIIVRSAYNEVFTFLFIPLILLGLSYLVDQKPSMKKSYLYLVIGYTGLLYSHWSIALYFTLFLITFAFIYRKELFQKEKLILLGKVVLTVTLFLLPMLVSMLEQRFGGNYLVFQKDYVSGLAFLRTYNNTLRDYFIPEQDYSWAIPRFMNVVVLVLLVITLIVFFQKKKKEKNLKFLLLFSLVSFIVTLSFFPWEIVPSPLYMIQFSWRCETFLVISLSLLVPYFLTAIQKKHQKVVFCIVEGLILLTSIPLLIQLSNHTYILEKVEPNNGMGHSMEYLPVKTYENIDYYTNRNQDINIIEGTATVEVIENNTPNLSFKVQNNSDTFTLELPRLYYLGYQLEGEKVLSIEESEYGMVQVTVGGNGTYHLTYPGTTLYRIASFAPLLGIALLLYILKKVSN